MIFGRSGTNNFRIPRVQLLQKTRPVLTRSLVVCSAVSLGIISNLSVASATAASHQVVHVPPLLHSSSALGHQSPSSGKILAKIRSHQSSQGWHVTQGAISLNQVSCNSNNMCIGLGTQIGNQSTVILTNQGANSTWTVVNSNLAYNLNAASCPSVTICIAIGYNPALIQGVALYSDDGGTSWDQASLPSIPNTANPSGPPQTTLVTSELNSLSCVSTTTCWAAGNGPYGQISGVILVTSDSGATWNVVAQNLPSSLDSISCVSSNFCETVGAGNVYSSTTPTTTSSAGSVWASEVFSTTSSAQEISCTSTQVCFILAGGGQNGNEVFSSSNGSSYVDTQKLPADGYTSMSCVGGSNCYLVGEIASNSLEPATSIITATSNSGSAWTNQTSPIAGGLSSISCISVSQCIAVSPYSAQVPSVIATVNGGQTWSVSSSGTPTDLSTLQIFDVTCPSQQSCLALGDGPSAGSTILSSQNGGLTWNVAITTGGPQPLSILTCSGTQVCWAAGPSYGGPYGFSLLTTTNGGVTWLVQPTPPTLSNVNSMSCVSTSTCVAFGNSTIALTNDGGSTWTIEQSQIGYNSLSQSLYCMPGSTKCWLAVGQQILSSPDLGQTWYPVSLAAPSDYLSYMGITCPSSQVCIIFGQYQAQLYTYKTTNGGASWTNNFAGSLDGINSVTPTSLECINLQSCWLLSNSNYQGSIILATNNGGTSWRPQLVTPISINSISCTTLLTCIALGGVYGFGGGGVVFTTSNGGMEGAPTISSISQQSGPDNQDVAININGSNLSSITTIEIGSTKSSDFTIDSDSQITISLPPSYSVLSQTFDIGVINSQGSVAHSPELFQSVAPKALTPGDGFWTVNYGGYIYAAGSAPYFGNASSVTLGAWPDVHYYSVISITGNVDGDGYWTATQNGQVTAFGSAKFYGDLAALSLKVSNIVAIRRTFDGKGYWLFGSDGGVFAFGDAHFYGSAFYNYPTHPVVSAQATPDGKGYWLVTSDGGIFSFGDAHFYGSDSCTGCHPFFQNNPVVSMAPTSDGKGYWIVYQSGFVDAHGDARLYPASAQMPQAIVALIPTPDSLGYWLVSEYGQLYEFGDAPFLSFFGGGIVDASS